MGAFLGRDAILAAKTLKTEQVHVPEWTDPATGADTVMVRELSGRERDEYEASMAVQRGGKMIPDIRNLRAKLVARSVIGEDGGPVFAPEDVDILGELSAAALDRVFEVASRLSGLSEADLEAASGNSGTGQAAGSSST